MALGGLVLGSLILYLKGTRIVMFQLSGFFTIYYRGLEFRIWGQILTEEALPQQMAPQIPILAIKAPNIVA